MFLKLTRLACWQEARSMLEEGVTPWAVAEWIQKTRREYLHVKPVSLVRQLTRFNEAMKADAVKDQPKSLIDRGVIGTDLSKFDQLNELKKLALIQKARIEKDLELEQKMPKLLKDLRAEIVMLSDLLEKILRLEVELGIRKKAPFQVDHRHAHVGVFAEGSLGELLGLMPPEERTRFRCLIQDAYKNRQLGGGDEDRGVSGGREEHADGDGGTEVPVAD